jgi:acetyl esterase/lipase
MSWQARLTKRLIPFQLSGWMEGPVTEKRVKIERMNRFARLPPGVQIEPATANGIPAAWITAPDAQTGALLYLHGGAYTTGSIASHRDLAARLAVATGLRVLSVDYRLAPEDPYPAALRDALAAYRWLLAQYIEPEQIAIAGDSAGGGLALAALLALRDGGDPLPAAAVCLSPWTDLTLSGASMQEKAALDPILDPAGLARFAALYAGSHPLDDPLISPHFADLRGLPPLLIQVGTDEVLFDDARRLAEHGRAAGLDTTLQVWDDLFHVFQAVPFLPETREALGHIDRFTAVHLGAQT